MTRVPTELLRDMLALTRGLPKMLRNQQAREWERWEQPLLWHKTVAILGVGAIEKRPVVVDDQVVIRPMMYVALSYDHRIVDGREAVTFLKHIKECIENPERIMMEI